MSPSAEAGSSLRATAAASAHALLSPGCAPEERDGYLDLIGEQDPTGSHPGQRLMLSRALPVVYERLWRPVGARVLMGMGGPGTRGEHDIALEMLRIGGEDTVLDLACGPGNFTRSFADAAPDGLVVGLDASETMLRRAVQDTRHENAIYIRGDAANLPFSDGRFDAVCCFAALYLIDRPFTAMQEIVRVLAPDGRVALLTSCNRGPLPTRVTGPLVHALTGIRVFSRNDLTDALSTAGLIDVKQRVTGLAQFVSARKP